MFLDELSLITQMYLNWAINLDPHLILWTRRHSFFMGSLGLKGLIG